MSVTSHGPEPCASAIPPLLRTRILQHFWILQSRLQFRAKKLLQCVVQKQSNKRGRFRGRLVVKKHCTKAKSCFMFNTLQTSKKPGVLSYFGLDTRLYVQRRGWDSNPRALADKRFSRPPRYDHFDTSAIELLHYITIVNLCQSLKIYHKGQLKIYHKTGNSWFFVEIFP